MRSLLQHRYNVDKEFKAALDQAGPIDHPMGGSVWTHAFPRLMNELNPNLKREKDRSAMARMVLNLIGAQTEIREKRIWVENPDTGNLISEMEYTEHPVINLSVNAVPYESVLVGNALLGGTDYADPGKVQLYDQQYIKEASTTEASKDELDEGSAFGGG